MSDPRSNPDRTGPPEPSGHESGAPECGEPEGGVYEWYQRGLALLGQGSPAAALQLLERAAEAEPGTQSILEAIGRAQYASGRYADAAASFATLVERNPVDDYARYGLGLAATRNGDLDTAVEHLTVAASLHPEHRHYRTALQTARRTREARG